MTDLDGATRLPPENMAWADAGQFAAEWNSLDQQERETCFQWMRQSSDAGRLCSIEQHKRRIGELREFTRKCAGIVEQRDRQLPDAGDRVRRQALFDALDVVKGAGDPVSIAALWSYIGAQEGLPS